MKARHLMALAFVLSLLITVTAHAWVIETVDTFGPLNLESSTSIALDGSGKVHIGYYDPVNLDLKYANNVLGYWATSTPDFGGDVGEDTSIAADSSGYVHIGYYDVTNGDLKYANNGAGAWSTVTVDSTGDVGHYTSMGLISSETGLLISYYDATNGDLKLAALPLGTFPVDSTGDVGRYTSIALDSSDHVHISYYDYTNGDLKYTTDTTGSFVATTVDPTGDVGQHTSIALDSSDKAHISYYDVTNGDLKYANNVLGYWANSTLESSFDRGKYTSIAVDSSNNVHIIYWVRAGLVDSLVYATNASGPWASTTVDSGIFLMNFSMALDNSGKAHISYFDGTESRIKYATNACNDNDFDGHDDAACGGDDCNDLNPFIFPSNPNTNCDCAEPNPQGTNEICGNGIDEDCTGSDLPCGSCSGTATASTLGSRSAPETSDLGSHLGYFLLPVGALIAISFWRRKR